MTSFEIGLWALAAMVTLVYLGLHVPIALILTSWIGVWAIKGSPVLAGKLLALAAANSIQGELRIVLDDDNGSAAGQALLKAFWQDRVTLEMVLACGGTIAPGWQA